MFIINHLIQRPAYKALLIHYGHEMNLITLVSHLEQSDDCIGKVVRPERNSIHLQQLSSVLT